MATRLAYDRGIVDSLELANGVVIFGGSVAPTNGPTGTGAGFAGPNSIYLAGGKTHQNTNTKASPTWQSIGDIAAAEVALANGKLLVGGVSGAAAEQTPSGDLTMTNGGVFALDPRLVQYVEVEVTNAELKALRATPKTLVAAPGAGKVLHFLGAVLLLDYGGTNAFTESADNLLVRYENGAGVAVSDVIECTGFIDATADTLTAAVPVKDPITAKTACENKALVLHNNGDGEWGGNAGADTVMRVKVAYRVFSTGW